METTQTLESLFRELLTPIIRDAVDQALAKYLSTPAAPQQPAPELMDVKLAATFLHLSVPTIYGLVHSRLIPYYKRRQRLYFKKNDLDQWIESGRRSTIQEIKEAAVQSLAKGRRR